MNWARRNTETRERMKQRPVDTNLAETNRRGVAQWESKEMQAYVAGSTPAPATIRRCPEPLIFALLLLALSGIGCSGHDGRVILTSANGYAFAEARYSERCAPVAPVGCKERYEAVIRWKRALDEASEAYKRGGKLPDQLGALKAAEAEARKPW